MDDKVEFQLHNYGRVSKRDSIRYSPERGPRRLTFTGNFTPSVKLFDITAAARRASMRQDILNTVLKRTESRMLDDNMCSINPIYEDPRDDIGDKPPKPPRKRTVQGIAAVTSSPKSNRDTKLTLKEQRKKLTKKYEGLITTLLEKCEENVLLISERDSHITKLKEKLKTVLEYNKLFAEENDQLKQQYSELVKYIDECKTVIREERDRCKELEEKNGQLKEKVKQFMVPDKDAPEQPMTVPLVEVCMSCSSRQILLNQAKEQNSRLHKDMQALKDLLYRLNVQLSRYQEKLRTRIHAEDARAPGGGGAGYDSLIATSIGIKGNYGVTTGDGDGSEQPPAASPRVADLSGLLSTQALAPLFDAYQEHLQEKDNLILDYEKQFENINKKSKQVVDENKTLSERVTALEEEVTQARQSYKKLMVEKEMGDIEKATLQERVEKAETKLKEVYELYEDKMAAMMRDYETVHREYFTVRSALEASAGKVAALDAMRARTVPADLHERRLDHCKRLLEELKHQYGMETERKTEQLAKLEQQLKILEEKHNKLVEAHDAAKTELDTALKNVRLYRKAAVIFRGRWRAAAARAQRGRRAPLPAHPAHPAPAPPAAPLRAALIKLETIRNEIKVVKARARSSLAELERRVAQRERRAAHAQAELRRELERAALALRHKEGIIRSLIDKVADVEEVRLSQTNAHRLQGIVSDSSPDRSEVRVSDDSVDGERDPTVKLVPVDGGYYRDKPANKAK